MMSILALMGLFAALRLARDASWKHALGGLATVQLGLAGNVAGQTASTHSPVEANGGSRMNVTCRGRWFVCTA